MAVHISKESSDAPKREHDNEQDVVDFHIIQKSVGFDVAALSYSAKECDLIAGFGSRKLRCTLKGGFFKRCPQLP